MIVQPIVQQNIGGGMARGRRQRQEILVDPAEDVAGAVDRAAPAMIAAFDQVSVPMRERSAVAEEECRAVASLRDALIPKLISGELRVKEAERLVAEAAG